MIQRKWWMRAMLSAVVTVALTACGGSDDPAVAPPPPAPLIGSATVGAAGGFVDGPDGVRLGVPPGAVDSDVTFRIARDGSGAPSLPGGIDLLSAVYAVTPHGQVFNLPVSVRVPSDIAQAAGRPTFLMKAEPGGRWAVIGTESGAAAALTASIDSLSYVAVGACTNNLPPNSPFAQNCPTSNVLRFELLTDSGTPFPVSQDTTYSAIQPVILITTPTVLAARLTWTRPPFPARTDLLTTGSRLNADTNRQAGIEWSSEAPNFAEVTENVTRSFTITVTPAQVASARRPDGVVRPLWAQALAGPWEYRAVIPIRIRDVSASTPAPAPAPTITQQPANAGVVEGQPASFSVVASVTPAVALTYQWSRRADANAAFAPIAGATAATFNLVATALTDNGAQFQVVVCAAPTLCVTSNPATVTVTRAPVAPSFTMQPASIAVVAGQTASFTVTATGNPLPRIDWQSAPAGDPNNFTALSVPPGCVRTDPPASGTSTTATCTVGPLALAESGRRYRAAATNAVTTTNSTVAMVTVNAAPVAPSITVQPQPQTTMVGGNAAFSVTATGTAPLGYAWKVNGTPLPSISGQFNTGTCIGNVTYGNGNATITLSGVTVGCNGVAITVEVSNGIPPNALSNSVTLTVNPVTAGLSLLAGAIGGQGSLDGTGTEARVVFGPQNGIALDASGTAYFSDFFNNVRKVTPAGVVTTLAGMSSPLRGAAGVAVDVAGNVFVAEYNVSRILRIAPDGVISVWAGGVQGDRDGTGTEAQFAQPYGLAIDAAGNLYVSEVPSQRNAKIRKISPTRVVTTFYDFGAPNGLGSLAVDASGNVYAAGGSVVLRITPAGVASVFAGNASEPGNVDGTGTAARFNGINGVAVAADGNLYLTDGNNRTIRRITPAGVVTSVSGGSAIGDGAGAAAGYDYPSAIGAAPGGDLLIGDVETMRKLAPLPNYFASTFLGSRAQRGTQDGSGAAARFLFNGNVVLDTAGNAYVGDGQRIRKVQPDGLVTTLAVTPSRHLAFDPVSGGLVAANTFEVWRVSTAGVVTRLAGSPVGGYVDGQGANAAFYQIGGLAVDRAGNVFVSELLSHTIRRITPAGVVTTIAGARDESGTADGPAATARFNSPGALAVDANDNLFVGDSGGLTIRKVTPAGAVSTAAGMPNVVGSNDGIGPAATFRGISTLAFDPSGRLVIADRCTLRRMLPANFAVSTVLGVDGQCGVALGSSPRINQTIGVAVRPDGRIVLMSEFAVLEAAAP